MSWNEGSSTYDMAWPVLSCLPFSSSNAAAGVNKNEGSRAYLVLLFKRTEGAYRWKNLPLTMARREFDWRDLPSIGAIVRSCACASVWYFFFFSLSILSFSRSVLLLAGCCCLALPPPLPLLSRRASVLTMSVSTL